MKNKEINLTFFQKLERLEPIEILGAARILGVSLAGQAPPTPAKGEEPQTEIVLNCEREVKENSHDSELSEAAHAQTASNSDLASPTEREPVKNFEVRPADDIIKDIVIAYSNLNRTQKRNFDSILNAAVRRGNEKFRGE